MCLELLLDEYTGKFHTSLVNMLVLTSCYDPRFVLLVPGSDTENNRGRCCPALRDGDCRGLLCVARRVLVSVRPLLVSVSPSVPSPFDICGCSLPLS